jgi:hypothetical protein
MGNPAEFPEGGEGTSERSWGRVGRVRWRPHPAELPPPDFASRTLVAEIVKLRSRVNALENELTIAKLGGRLGGGIGGPAEFPPPELPEAEIAEIVPPEIGPPEAEIAELPILQALSELLDQQISVAMERVLNEVAGLREEIARLGRSEG